jgi:hypothetical protein
VRLRLDEPLVADRLAHQAALGERLFVRAPSTCRSMFGVGDRLIALLASPDGEAR